MTAEETATIHEYIASNDLFNDVEAITKRNWRGAGSRATYYNAVAKSKRGEEWNLVEWLMMMEAEKLVHLHRRHENKLAQQAA